MPLILGTNSIKDTGFNVSNSLRFNKAGGSDDFLDLQYAADGNRKTFTISFWMKLSKLNTNMYPFSIYDTSSSYQADIRHGSSGQLRMLATDTAGTQRLHLLTTRVFRDTTSWYHICWQVDTTQSTESNRVKLYVNGVQETVFSTETYPPQNTDLRWNGRNNADTGGVTRVGAIQGGTGAFDGYMSEVVFIDGTALGPTSFGEFDSDSGIWKPINVSGLTFGTNGFYLEFKQTGTSQNSSGFGADTSGNDNHFAVNNFTAVDQCTDTCTNNFCTLNSLYYYSTTFTFSEGNLKATTGAAWKTAGGTIGMNSGKWYWEFTKSGSYVEVGIGDLKGFAQGGSNYQGLSHTQDTDAIGIYYNTNGEIYSNNTSGAETNPGAYGASWDTEVIGCALDLDSSQNTVTFYKANSSQGAWNIQDPVEGYTPSFTIYNSNATVNFGNPSSALSSAESDENGFGSFEYAPPSGFLAICTKNLAENS